MFRTTTLLPCSLVVRSEVFRGTFSVMPDLIAKASLKIECY
jgi:hypothetical protein